MINLHALNYKIQQQRKKFNNDEIVEIEQQQRQLLSNMDLIQQKLEKIEKMSNKKIRMPSIHQVQHYLPHRRKILASLLML